MTTLGMGAEEMQAIAGIVQEVLAATKPSAIESGKNAGQPSQVKFATDEKVLGRAQARVKELLTKYPLYPGIDL